MRSRLTQLWTDNRGLATSLIEVSMVIAITAVLTSVAMEVSTTQVTSANTQTGNSEIKLIGVSVLSFIQDTGFVPAFKSGQSVGPNDGFVLVRESNESP